MKYIIDRTKWLRGEGSYDSYLLRSSDGKMCCLGQVSMQCGVMQDDLGGVSAPLLLADAQRILLPSWLFDGGSHSEDATLAMTENDDLDEDDGLREEILKGIFADHGDQLEFIN